MFNRLTDKFQSLLQYGKMPSATDLADLRAYLLDSDVALPVADVLIARIEEMLRQSEAKGLKTKERLYKALYDSIQYILENQATHSFSGNGPIMLVGLQGTGKTTTVAKLGYRLQNEHKKVQLTSLDVYRPAAREQLETLGENNHISVFNTEDKKPKKIVKKATQHADSDTIILFDTAGRLHIDDVLMRELKELQTLINPREVILVADAMTGQDALKVAESFHKALGLTGIIMSRSEGDSRGGAILSMAYVTGCPIYFLGVGEKVEDLDVFNATRFTERLLGGGDIMSLVERAEQVIDEQTAKQAEKSFKSGNFTLEDLRSQIEQMEKMGGLSALAKYLPRSMKNMMNAVNPKLANFSKQKSILYSMTKKERLIPKIIHQNRKKRIARGSGVSISEVDKLLKQYEKMKQTMKKMKKLQNSGLAGQKGLQDLMGGGEGEGMNQDFLNRFN